MSEHVKHGLSSEHATVPGPLAVYIIWHPDFVGGGELARSIYDWFRTVDGRPSMRGSEIPVYYRSQPWSADLDLLDRTAVPRSSVDVDHGDQELFFPYRPFSIADSDCAVVVALVDAEMVCDVGWRKHLYALGKAHSDPGFKLLLVPVELGPGCFSLHPIISGINAVRVDHWDDQSISPDQRLARRKIRLRRHLTQVMVRRLRDEKTPPLGNDNLLPRSVFLSHAKSDGVEVAEAIQREALQLGQIDAFLDTRDLVWAKEWATPMLKAAGVATSAFVAIVSDRYADRYWCRQEVRQARKPQCVSPEGAAQLWWVQPLVAVNTQQTGWTRVLPELSGVPLIRWRDESDTAAILDRVMLEALQSHVHMRYASNLSCLLSDDQSRHYLSFAPDPHTLLEWFTEAGLKQIMCQPAGQEGLRVVYPGHGLSIEEEGRLIEWFGQDVTFQSLDAAVDEKAMDEEMPARIHDPSLHCVALVTEPTETRALNALGNGPEHVDEFILRVARPLLHQGFGIQLGAGLNKQGWLRETLLEAASGANEVSRVPSTSTHPATDVDVAELAERHPALSCLLAWPQSTELPRSEEAELHARVVFHRHDADCEHEAVRRADSATASRQHGADQASFALLFAGATSSNGGWAPLIMEFAAAMSALGKPAIPLAMFGGLSRVLVKWLLDDTDALSEELALALSSPGGDDQDPKLADLLSHEDALRTRRSEIRKKIVEGLVRLKRTMRPPQDGCYHGLSWDDLETLMCTDSVRVVRRILCWKLLPNLPTGNRQI